MAEHKDIVVIGAGIAGLYVSYTLQKKDKSKSILILEKNGKQWVGGRATNDSFYGANIVVGAGIGRYKKDKLLKKLMEEMNIPIQTFKIDPQYSSLISPLDGKQIMKELKDKYKGESETFREYAVKHLGKTKYIDFICTIGYTDYELEDAEDVLFHYGMEDNVCCYEGFRVPWNLLANRMMKRIGQHHFRFHCDVQRIKRFPSGEIEIHSSSHKYTCNQLIIATPIDTIRKLLPSLSIYQEIVGQPFLRLYAKFNEHSHQILQQIIQRYTVVPQPLQKIIPMSNGVYMISYSDNASAIEMKKHIQHKEKCARLVERALGIAPNTLTILGLRAYYWKIGTH